MKKIAFFIPCCVIAVLSFGQITPTNYAAPQNWVINHNLGKHIPIDPSYTIVQPDTNIRTVVTLPYDTTSLYNIFCVYPTIPTGGGIGVHVHPLAFDSATVVPIVTDMFSQYGRYGKIFTPYYRQANGATFTSTNKNNQAVTLDTALTDVIAAFNYFYTNCNNGKKIILIGHSQGSVLLGMMLRYFEMTNPSILSDIDFSVLPGFRTGPHTLNSSNTGGWFQNYPICQTPSDLNCIMTWQTFRLTTSMGTDPSINHIYNDTLVNWGFHYQDFDTINYQILNDPLYFTTQDTINYTIYPNSLINYGSISTHYVVQEKFYQAIDNQISDDYGLITTRIYYGPTDKRQDPIPLFPANYHVYDHYISAGAIHSIIQNKISITTGIQYNHYDFLSVNVFPNPSQSGVFQFNFSTQNIIVNSWTVYNMLGQPIMTGKANNFQLKEKGFYFIAFDTNKGKTTKKIIYE